MSKIEWTDKTSNPIKEVGVRPEARPEMTLNRDMLESWSRMRKPKKHFIGSMTDIAGEWVPDEMVFDLIDAMAAAPRQTFQVLTKRPERLAHLVAKWIYDTRSVLFPDNIWIGTSAEDQKRLDERLQWLIRSNVSIKFLSIEPLLGPIKIPTDNPWELVDWAIIGGESGPNARPLNIAWVKDILEQCEDVDIPVFVKQLGSHWARRNGAIDRKGGDPWEWPEWARVRMFPGDRW